MPCKDTDLSVSEETRTSTSLSPFVQLPKPSCTPIIPNGSAATETCPFD